MEQSDIDNFIPSIDLQIEHIALDHTMNPILDDNKDLLSGGIKWDILREVAAAAKAVIVWISEARLIKDKVEIQLLNQCLWISCLEKQAIEACSYNCEH